MTRSNGPSSDPRTVIALIFRVLDEPRRALCAIAITAPLIGTIAQLSGARPVLGVSMGWIGTAGGFLLAALLAWLRRKARTRVDDVSTLRTLDQAESYTPT